MAVANRRHGWQISRVSMTGVKVTNLAAYRFVELSGLKELREELLGLCKDAGLKGTILLSVEGINLFVAGGGGSVDGEVEADSGFGGFCGESQCER